MPTPSISSAHVHGQGLRHTPNVAIQGRLVLVVPIDMVVSEVPPLVESPHPAKGNVVGTEKSAETYANGGVKGQMPTNARGQTHARRHTRARTHTNTHTRTHDRHARGWAGLHPPSNTTAEH